MSYFPTQATLTVAGRVFTDLVNLKVLHAYPGGAVSPYSTAIEQNSTTGYTPSGANKFRVLAITSSPQSATAGNLYMYTGDTDTTATPSVDTTNPVYWGGDSNMATVFKATDAEIEVASAVELLVPNGKYLICSSQGGPYAGLVTIYGYEEA